MRGRNLSRKPRHLVSVAWHAGSNTYALRCVLCRWALGSLSLRDAMKARRTHLREAHS